MDDLFEEYNKGWLFLVMKEGFVLDR